MPVSDVSREAVALVVRDVIAVVLPSVPRGAIAGNKHLRELGADSVDRVEIILMLLERLSLDEPMTTFATVPDVDGLVTLLHARCSS
ncbi:MAG TPA: phosphopantetheine-binding protein [Thermoanaerobaculia bacterium]|nr:phosphopantetheine-binding protein [Thermoanaerobaculia bacterium]